MTIGISDEISVKFFHQKDKKDETLDSLQQYKTGIQTNQMIQRRMVPNSKFPKRSQENVGSETKTQKCRKISSALN